LTKIARSLPEAGRCRKRSLVSISGPEHMRFGYRGINQVGAAPLRPWAFDQLHEAEGQSPPRVVRCRSESADFIQFPLVMMEISLELTEEWQMKSC
jgi:hypothetical protein